MTQTTITNIGSIERIARIGAGLALTLSVAFQPATLGIAAILPLLAIYPMMTGAIGWDPIYSVFERTQSRSIKPVAAHVAAS
jgi:hypothetical protein